MHKELVFIGRMIYDSHQSLINLCSFPSFHKTKEDMYIYMYAKYVMYVCIFFGGGTVYCNHRERFERNSHLRQRISRRDMNIIHISDKRIQATSKNFTISDVVFTVVGGRRCIDSPSSLRHQ